MPLLQSWCGIAPNPPMLLLAALALEPLLGEARGLLARLPHPVRLVGVSVSWLDRKLNREHRSAAERRRRGMLLVVVVCASSVAVGGGAAWLARQVPFGWLFELALMIALLAQRSLFQHVRRVGEALRSDGLEAARAQVAHIVGRDVRQLDEHGIARAAIESCAENFSDAVVAPAFWYILLGLPGMFVYKVINTMDSMIGHRSPRYRAFGWAAARLDDVVNLIPARLAGLYLACAAKSNAVYVAYNAARAFVSGDQSRPVPVHLRNAPTRLMRELGYGREYRYAHDEPEAYAAGEDYFPEGMPKVQWYAPTDRGLEARIAEKLAHLRALDRKARKDAGNTDEPDTKNE